MGDTEEKSWPCPRATDRESFSDEFRRRAAAVLARRNDIDADEVDPRTVTVRLKAAGDEESDYGIDTWLVIEGGAEGGLALEALFESYDAFGEMLIALDAVPAARR